MKKSIISAAVAALALGVAFSSPAAAADTTACLITKTDTNPFFVKMKEGAEAKAKEIGVTLKAYAGTVDGDSESQVAAIETCIADGAKGILIAASDTKGIVPSVQKARDARLFFPPGECTRSEIVEESASHVVREATILGDDITEIMLPNSYHVATMDYDADTIFAASTAFVERVSADRIQA